MNRGTTPALLLLLLAAPVAANELASPLAPAHLAVPTSAGEGSPARPPLVRRGADQVPELWLAQRAIEREWGASEDTVYRTVEVKEWKLEGLALGLSGAVPGAGQLYLGEGSGWLFLTAEALGWAGRTITRRRGDSLRDDAAALIGDPTDPAAGWSFERYSTATGEQPSDLRALWDHDRKAFYEALARDSRYRFGFAGSDPFAPFDDFRGLHDSSQDRYRQSRYLEIALWANHAVAAFDALRAARFHNLPLRRSLELQLTGSPRRYGGAYRAAVVRRF
jgi:hypothetical protein